jgi:hypothetical protein
MGSDLLTCSQEVIYHHFRKPCNVREYYPNASSVGALFLNIYTNEKALGTRSAHVKRGINILAQINGAT